MGFFSFLKNQRIESECACCTRPLDLLIKAQCFESEQPDYFSKKYSIFGMFNCDYCKYDISVLFHKSLKEIKLSIYDCDKLENEIEEELEKIESEIDETEEFLSSEPDSKKHNTQLEKLQKKYEKYEDRLYKKLEKSEMKCSRISERVMNRKNPPPHQNVKVLGDVARLES